jgi:predicted TPR repeat methyltransferase
MRMPDLNQVYKLILDCISYSTVLDVGCGEGGSLKPLPLKSQCRYLIGVDIKSGK